MRPSCAHTAAGQSSDKAAKLTGILLTHSAWHGPWCWGDFAKRLAQRGHDIRAVEPRGHDRSPRRIWYRVRVYVEDLRHAAVGHDMMRDSGWQKVVDCVDTWIREHQDAAQVRCEA